jgi:hypothetical protein
MLIIVVGTVIEIGPVIIVVAIITAGLVVVVSKSMET